MSEKGPAAETKGAGTNAQAVGIWTGAWEESGVDIWLCREGQRKKKLERTWRDTKNNRKFFRSGNQEREVKKGVTF